MKRLLFPILLGLIAVLSATANDKIRKETYIYSMKGADTLHLDKYDIPDGQIKPCVIFMFGGGFFSGARDEEFYIPYYHFLINEGYTVVAIDYRLGFKNVQNETPDGIRGFLNLFEQTIFMAVEDLFDATNFVLRHAESWNIDKNTIVTSGSSAGAISVLQGEYERCNRTEIANVLPADFKYAGVISFAGAIYSNHGNLKWNDTPAPIQLFHGDADMNVPYDRIKIFRLGFFGSKYIADKYQKKGFPYFFYMEKNADHKIAGDPMVNNQDEIRTFLRKYVKEKRQLQSIIEVSPMNQPEVNKKFKITDYIRANFGE